MRPVIILICAAAVSAALCLDGLTATAPQPGTNIEQTLSALGKVEAKSTGRDALMVTITGNPAGTGHSTIPAGTIAEAADGVRIVTLRTATVRISSGEVSTADIPAVSLTSTPMGELRSFRLLDERDARLQGFLEYAATLDDLPRATAQAAVLALTEDITFQQWLRATGAADQRAAADAVVNAIDALGILRKVSPGKAFALAVDNELKIRALRNPATRGKAVQLYGISVPGDDLTPAGTAPDLQQLLHTKSGDNCPVCRMRNRAGSGSDL